MSKDIVKKLQKTRKLGMALGGGGARGIAHLGAWKVLDEHGIEPDIVAGTSFGSLIGAFYCAGYTWEETLDRFVNAKWRKILDVSLKGGLMRGEAFGKALSEHLPATFEELEKPLVTICTHIESGKRTAFTSGDLIKAVRASCCFPGIFDPVEINGEYYIDGVIVDNVPVSALRENKAGRSIAVSVNSPLDYPVMEEDTTKWWSRLRKKAGFTKLGLPLDIIIKSIEIMVESITEENIEKYKPDLYIQADLSNYKIYSFDKLDAIFKAGEDAAVKAING